MKAFFLDIVKAIADFICAIA